MNFFVNDVFGTAENGLASPDRLKTMVDDRIVESEAPATAPEPAGRRPQIEQCYKTIKRDIISGKRRPGERLRIDRLRAIYGVGASPIREALQRLAADGLVHALERRGFQVAPIDKAEFLDLNLARMNVEAAALRLAIEHGDDEWESNIVAATYRLEKGDHLLGVDTTGALDSWEELNKAFHAALVAGCPSRWLIRTRAMLHDQCERYRRIAVTGDRSRENLLEEHRRIAHAALDRNIELADELLREHLVRIEERLSYKINSE